MAIRLSFSALVWALFSSVAFAAATLLEDVALLSEGPGNITVTPDRRIVLSMHQFFSSRLRVAVLTEQGSLAAFPDAAWNAGGAGTAVALDSVLGIQSDASGIVRMLDNGMRAGSVPKLVGWDSRGEKLARVIYLRPPVTPANAFVNDLAVDEKHQAMDIADPARGSNAALVVVDLVSGLARRVLEGHRSVIPEKEYQAYALISVS